VSNEYAPLSAGTTARGVATSPLLAAGLLLVAAAVGLGAIGLSSAQPGPAIVWSSVALAVYCTGLLLLTGLSLGTGGLGLAAWRIGSWSLVWCVLAFGLATITWIAPQTGAAAEIVPASVMRALWLTAVAFTLLAAGYCAGPRAMAVRQAGRVTATLRRRFTDDIRSPAVPWLLFTIGLACQAATQATTGRFGYVGNVASSVSSASAYDQYLALAGECVPLAVAAAAVRAYRTGERGAWLTLGVLFTAAIILGAVGGTKQSFVVAILAVIIPRTVSRGRLPWGGVLAAVLSFLLLVIPFNLAYRASARGAVTLSTAGAVAAAPSILRQVVATDLRPSVLGQSASFLAQRIRSIDSPAIIMQRTPGQIPYSSPGQLAEAPVLDVIPRIVWPGKPILAVGYQVSQEYFELPSNLYTSSDVTPEADLYRHGGWIPVIAGMFLLGCLFRVLDDVADVSRNLHGSFLVILLFPQIVQAGSDWSTLLAGMPGIILLWLVVVAFSFGRQTAPVISIPLANRPLRKARPHASTR
jgi:hypothetical protein